MVTEFYDTNLPNQTRSLQNLNPTDITIVTNNSYIDEKPISEDEFIISRYLYLLGEKQKNGKYICPNCGEDKLSINSDGKKFNCFGGCEDPKAIAYQLRAKNGEFNGKKHIYNESYQAKKTGYEISKRTANGKTKLTEIISFVAEEFKYLKFNTQTLEPWLLDKPFSKKVCELDKLYIWVARKYGKEYPKEKLTDTVLLLAQENQFNPLEQELRLLANIESVDDPTILDNLSTRVLGTSNPLYDQYLKCWLLAAVGRVLLPGCYVRNVLILRGEQDIGKTTFFQILGGDYFSSSLGDARDKDEIMVAHANWILEWGELETIWGKKARGEIKRFITQTHDTFRPPYGRTTITQPRKFILCGTTNEQEFLTDRTGNNRFWVIDCGNRKINLDWIEKYRSAILAMATATVLKEIEYSKSEVAKGKLWQLPSNYLALDSKNSEIFLESHEWEEVIEKVIDSFGSCGWIDPQKIWDELEIAKRDRPKFKTQVSSLMNRLGWKSGFKWLDGKSKRVWIPIK